MKMIKMIMLAMAVVAWVTVSSVEAAVIYDSRTTWESATPGFANLDFESYAGNGSQIGDFTDSGISFDAVNTVVASEDYLYTWGPSSGWDIGSGKWILGGFGIPGSYRRYTDVTVPGTYDSFGVDVGLYAASGEVSVLADTSFGIYELVVTTTAADITKFVGFNLEAGETLNYVRIEAAPIGLSDDAFLFDNFSVGVIPEPASIGLIGLCASGIFFTRRFFRV